MIEKLKKKIVVDSTIMLNRMNFGIRCCVELRFSFSEILSNSFTDNLKQLGTVQSTSEVAKFFKSYYISKNFYNLKFS